MNDLLRSEIRRALSRRLMRIFAAAAVTGILVAGVATFARSHRADGSQEARRQYEATIDRCVRGEVDLPAPPDVDREEFCRYSGFIQPPSDPTFRLTKMHNVLRGTTVPLVIAAFLLGASLIGAEWRAGTMTTALTWEPNRNRLLLAKLAVAVLVCTALAVVLQALLFAAVTPAALLRGSTEGVNGQFFRSIAGVLGRGALVVAVASALGFSIAATGRNTAAALGIGFFYLAILEGFLGGALPWFRPWSFVGNSIVWVSGEKTLEVGGRTVTQAGIVLAGYAAGVSALATAIFARRDVT